MISLKLLSFSEMSISEKCESFQWRESFCDSAVLEHFPVERDRLSARPRESGDPEPRAGSLWIPACAGMSGPCCVEHFPAKACPGLDPGCAAVCRRTCDRCKETSLASINPRSIERKRR